MWFHGRQHLITTIFIISLIFCSISQSISFHCFDTRDLDGIIQLYASRANRRRPVGSQYRINLPRNLSSIEASVVMTRNSMFWKKGANFSYFQIPPKIRTTPFVRRIFLVFVNLGNQSLECFKVPGHSLISPVIGFSAYDASDPDNLGNQKLDFSISGSDNISIDFSSLVTHDQKTARTKCVTFGGNPESSFELRDVRRNYECSTRNSYGNFAIVVPDHKSEEISRWWWVGLGVVGFCVLVLFGLIGLRLARRKKIKEMKRQSEKSEAIGSVWIQNNGMPSADMMRTQPRIEP